jgi:hypothetical protein
MTGMRREPVDNHSSNDGSAPKSFQDGAAPSCQCDLNPDDRRLSFWTRFARGWTHYPWPGLSATSPMCGAWRATRSPVTGEEYGRVLHTRGRRKENKEKRHKPEKEPFVCGMQGGRHSLRCPLHENKTAACAKLLHKHKG